MRRHILLFLLILPLLLCSRYAESHEHPDDTASAPSAPSAGLPTAQPPNTDTALKERLGGKIPLDIVLRDEEGRSVRLGDVITGPTLVVPVYFGCTNLCNHLQWGVAGVLPSLKGTPGKDFRVLSVSLDDADTPQVASRYRNTYLGSLKTPFPPDGWRFLIGDAASLRRLTDAAGYHYKRQGREILHPVVSFVVARDGLIVRYLYGTSFLPKDVALAFAEARAGRVGATIRGAIRYCFSFDAASKSYEFNLLRVSATVVLACAGSFLAYLLVSGRKKRRGPGGA